MTVRYYCDKIVYRTALNTVVLTCDDSGIDGCYIGDANYEFDDPARSGPEHEIVSWVREEWDDNFAVGATLNAVCKALTTGLTKEVVDG